MLPPPEEILPHRPPMLLLDKVVEASETIVVATRIFKREEKVFEGHFGLRRLRNFSKSFIKIF